jgi:hypothetical protein
MRPYLIAATAVMAVAVLFLFGYSFVHDKAEVGKTLIFTAFVLASGMLGYGWAVRDRHTLIAKVGTSEIRFDLKEAPDQRLSFDLIAELHDFACHVLRYRAIPNWRSAVVHAATQPALQLPAVPAPPAPVTSSPPPAATLVAASPPAPRAAACQGCGNSPASRYKLPNGNTVEICDECKPIYVPDGAELMQPVSG